jgi:GAF domain-containing protein
VRGERLIHIADAAADEAYHNDPSWPQLVATGACSVLAVALRKDDSLLGYINVYRNVVGPFSEKQIALLENFAAQAVIAMENARLITETREALEQQTATAEVLQVINSSPGALDPVFDAMLEKAMRLCGAAFGELFINDDGDARLAAARGVPEAFAEFRHKSPARHSPVSVVARIFGGQSVVHTLDAKDEELYRRRDPQRVALVDLGGARTSLAVALVRDRAVLGLIHIYRQEVRAFSEKEIALLQNFAAQAVIAMENARLITETREALEQQTATAEVLGVINSSPGDLAPVFEAILGKAHSLCEAAYGVLFTYDGEAFRTAALHSVPQRYADFISPGPVSPTRGERNGLAQIVDGANVAHFVDAAADDAFQENPGTRAVVELGGARTMLVVALRKDTNLLGAITAYRQEVRPFTEKQISLLQNFAAQAVIAMENARLITETREALDQQTATAEILGVINSSPGDLAPVFDAMLEKAFRLCDGVQGSLWTFDGRRPRLAVARGLSAEFVEVLQEEWEGRGPSEHHPMSRLMGGERVVQILDMSVSDLYRTRDLTAVAAVELGRVRTLMFVALVKDDALVGVFIIARREVRAFSDKEIALVQNFAAQAVIAMENARLITETREALEQQTATAELLQVINSSPGDLAPVFDAILEKAHTLCGAAGGGLVIVEDDKVRAVAVHGEPRFAEYWMQLQWMPHWIGALAPLTRGEPLHIPDVTLNPNRESDQYNRLIELSDARTLLIVPLRKDNLLFGAITAFRHEVHLFSDKQIALLQNFAAQAVIAMENARLLNEIRQRQAELRVTFDNMGDGVAMFDSELRLAAWNLNFQRILDVPDDLLADQPSYSDYIRFLARRGEFGDTDIEAELGRRLEAIGQELRSEHTRPNGRVIEVRRNAVPDGGFVIIYGDVTERKRSEAEIRSARDTAERALQELQTTQASLVHAQKMAALGQLTAGIAHEIKNPLNFVNNFAELSGELLLELKETTAPAVAALGEDERAAVDEVVEMLRGNLDKIAEHGKRADGIVKSMLEHSRGVSGERRVVDLNALIEEALNLAYHGARAQDAGFNITLEREFDRSLAPTELAPQEMTRVFLNLFGNGFYATGKRQRDGARPEFRPTLRVATRDLGDAVEVRVRDNGAGIAPEIRDKLFQPFVTTKPTGEGTGLGLSIAWDIVTQQHGGTIEVDSREGEFTEFTIRLPRSR